MKFSVLQSIYKNDSPEFLNVAFESLLEQTLPASEIVVVKDGPVTPELENVLNKWQSKLPLKVVGYEENHGLGFALNFGLDHVTNELVCRMDSDDISIPDRFEKQVAFMEEHPEIDLFSGYITEFNDDPKNIVSVRKVPLDRNSIIRTLKKRNAFNHVTVCFRKSAVQKAGGYQSVPYFEDYDLWIRMIQNGAGVCNSDSVFVNVRIGNDMIGRRHGFAYALHEINFMKRQLASGFMSKTEYMKAFVLRVPVRLFPKFILSLVYRMLRK